MQFKEIETKYRAQDVKLQDFIKCLESLSPTHKIRVGSYDHYFVKNDNEAIRYREGAKPELTVKVKLNDKNNYIRVEVNCPLDPNTAEEARLRIVTAFCETLGFKHNFTIYKNCHIYYFENCNVVYYVVYDEELKERDRFIEIEMKEDGWLNEDQAWAELQRVEKQLVVLGITPARRMKRSLQELFIKSAA
jgi:adenylate cyclase class IV